MDIITPLDGEPMSVILKLVGDACNINCTYCYEKPKPYTTENFMTADVLSRALEKFGSRFLAIELHGGEPLLLGKQRTAELFDVIRNHEGGADIYLQTNGILLTKDWIEFLYQEWPEIQIGLSLDGDRTANEWRVDYRGKPTTAQVENTLGLLGELSKKVALISVVTSSALGREHAILSEFLRFDAIKVVSFVPCFDVGPEQQVPPWATTPLQYSDFLIRCYEIWKAEGWFEHFLLEPFGSIHRVLAGEDTSNCYFKDKKCAYVTTLYPDGRLGGCDRYSGDFFAATDLDLLESVEDISTFKRGPRVREGIEQVFEKCRGCDYRPICKGGCPSTRLGYLGTDLYEEYCSHRIAIIDAARADVPAGSLVVNIAQAGA